MKSIILCAFLLALVAADSGILTGQWNFKGTVYDIDQCTYFCCCPMGIVNVAADSSNSSQVIVRSSKWSNNAICKAMGLTGVDSKLALPFPSASTLQDLQTLSENYLFKNGDFEVVYYVDGIGSVPYSPTLNTTQFNLTMDQEFVYGPDGESGATCTVILNKFVLGGIDA